MSREAMYAAAGKALRERSVIRPTFDEMAQVAVDAALEQMEKEEAMRYLQVVNPGDKFRYSLTVDEPGTYAIVRLPDA